MTSETKKSSKSLFIIIPIIIAVFVGAIIFIPRLGGGSGGDDSAIDVSKYDFTTVIDGNEDNGGIADHIKGDETAPVTIFEYADYQCSGCANVNPWLEELLNEYKGKLRIVYRNFPIISLHSNAIAAASAVEAAGLQGFWKKYGDLLFSNQTEWYYASGTERTNLFMSYFTSVAGDAGDLAKFRADMASGTVKKKVYFDKAIAEALGVDETPTLFDEDGNKIEWVGENHTKTETLNLLRNFVDKKLEEKSAK